MGGILDEFTIAAVLFVGLLLALEAGFRLGRRAASEADAGEGSQVGAIQGAILGLLGLLLAFSFAAAGTRFLERQDLIVQEANAIGTAYLRADLLDEPYRSQLRATLQRYTEQRLAVSARLGQGIEPGALEDIERLHGRMWSAASAGVAARPLSMLGVLPPVNEVIDLHTTRMAAGRKHLPPIVMVLLLACSALSVGVMGYGCGLGGRRRAALTVAAATLIGAALWVTIDLDYPRAGLIRLSDAPLASLRFEAQPDGLAAP